MKRSSLPLYAAGVFTAVSGALAVYLSRRPKLRKELTSAETPAEAIKTFGDHMQKDGNHFITHLREYLQKQRGEAKAKGKYPVKKAARKQLRKANRAVQDVADRSEERAEAVLERE